MTDKKSPVCIDGAFSLNLADRAIAKGRVYLMKREAILSKNLALI